MADTFKELDDKVITYYEAETLLAQRFKTISRVGVGRQTGYLPPLTELRARRAFDEDDHWQLGEGFIGQLPTGDGYEDRTELLRRAFSPEAVISEVLDTHVGNVLGETPDIALESKDISESELAEILETVQEWFAKREGVKVLSEALRTSRRESASVLRAFIPYGMADGEGRVQAKDLEEALSKIWFRAEYIEDGGVIIDETTAKELGLFKYRVRIDQADISVCEYAYLDKNGSTVWGTSSAHTANIGSEIAEPFLLNGALPIYQMNSRAFITNAVCQAQRGLNLSGTMLTRNNNLAGSRERLAIGVQPPGTWAETGVDEAGNKVETFTAAEMKTGPATFNFLKPDAVYDDDGRVTAFANPNVIFTDPVPVDTFLETSNHWRTVIYSSAKMRHLLLADSATASGKSRIEARKEFQSSLNDSKQIVDPAGRWMIETALNIAAHFIGAKGRFNQTNASFDSRVSTIELTPEETAEIRSDYQAGLIDLRTALELRGMRNVDEVIERMEAVPVNEPTVT